MEAKFGDAGDGEVVSIEADEFGVVVDGEVDRVSESAGINRLGIENERVLQRTTSH